MKVNKQRRSFMSLMIALKDGEFVEIEHHGEKLKIQISKKKHKLVIDAPRSFVITRGDKKSEEGCQQEVQLDLGLTANTL